MTCWRTIKASSRLWIPLLLGIITTAGLAASIAAVSEQWTLYRTQEREDIEGFIPRYLQPTWTHSASASHTPINAGADLLEYILFQTAEDEIAYLESDAWNEGPARLRLDRHRFGWPLRSAFIDTHGIQGNQGKEETYHLLEEADDWAGLRTGAVLFHRQGNSSPDPRLPTAILPLGFLVDSAVFSLAWWLILFSPGAWKRRRRHSRGLCIKCAYPLDQADRCPECGTDARRMKHDYDTN